MLSINCLVFGDDRQHIFTVDILDTKNISALKDAIKEKKQFAFQQVDADTLVLWKVSLPNDESLNEKLKNFNFDPDKLLSPTDELSEVFSETPPRKHLHLVVKPPPVGNRALSTGERPFADQKLSSEHSLHKLWMLAREPQTTLFEPRPVQRDRSCPLTETNLLLNGRKWELPFPNRWKKSTGMLIPEKYLLTVE